jgi:iron complex transport system substrate-binding protein
MPAAPYRRRAIAIAAVALFVAACSSDGSESTKQDLAENKAAMVDKAAGEGSRPRLASTILLADELLWALGPEVQSRVVAVSALSDDPRYSETVGLWPAQLARVGPNPAELVALNPEVVFLASFSDQAYRAALDEHFELVVLGAFRGFDDYRTNVRAVAGGAGVPERAEALIADFDQRLAKLESKRPADESSWPTCIAWEGGYVAGALTTFDDAARAAGCVNAVSRAGVKSHAAVDTEQLLAWQPDFLVVSCAQPTDASCEARLGELSELAGISELVAVKEGRVVTVAPAQMSSVGPGMLDLAESLGERIRPGG